MKKLSGFTLVEMMVVIVVMGIIASVAVPKFINFNTDAHNAVLSSAKGSISSANELVYSKAVIQKKHQEGQVVTIDIDGESVDVVGGNIHMTPENLKKVIKTDLEVQDSKGLIIGGVNGVLLGFKDKDMSTCNLYVHNETGGALVYSLNDDKC